MTEPLWIDRPDELAAGVERWRASGLGRSRAEGGTAGDIALDTEFVFERTFRPRLGLIQIAAGGEIALIDTVRIADLSPLAALLQAENVRKILHSGSGDVPILRRATGASLRPLFDTQIAAAFAGLGPALSYAALIRELFAVELPKHETRTDWLRRPLSPAQLRYAAEDVEQLATAAAELERRLLALGRLEWAVEDSAALADLEADGALPAEAWRRVKGIDRLSPHGRAVARALAAWREREADRLDLARPFLLRDETLLALARGGWNGRTARRSESPRSRSPSSRATTRAGMRRTRRAGSRHSPRPAPRPTPARRPSSPPASRPRSATTAERSKSRSPSSSPAAAARSASPPSSSSPAASATAPSPPGASGGALSPTASAASAAASWAPTSTRSPPVRAPPGRSPRDRRAGAREPVWHRIWRS